MTIEDLKRIAPYASAKNISIYTPLLNKYMAQYGINTQARKAAFLATILHESSSLTYTEEIASGLAYEGRKDLGNIEAGDGKRYKGRGLIQITGRTNYERASKALGVDLVSNPQLLEQPEWAVKSACWWWQSKGLNELADKGDFRRITKIVNGGYNGWNSRLAYYNRAKEVLK
jgi:putative chitinase